MPAGYCLHTASFGKSVVHYGRINCCFSELALQQDGLCATCFLPCSFFFKTRMEAVIMVIHSWVAMVKSISPPPSATAECISLMRCLQPVCRAAAVAAAAAVC